ncbi:MAG: hypothetical protein IPM14_09905 [bacterium]|nr:hypothetical protein [bacterium]
MKLFKSILLLFLSILLISCDSGYEIKNNFYSQLEQCFYDFQKSRNIQELSFEKLTNFDWDSMAVAQGDESIGLPSNIITNKLGFECKPISTEQSRIYFIKNGRPVKIVNLQTTYHKPAIEFEPCNYDSTSEILIYSKNDSRFYVMSNSDTYEEGTIFLSPICNDIPNWMIEKTKK